MISGGKRLSVEWKPYNLTGANIWVADADLKEVEALQIDGQRATRARYPNLPQGIEVSCGYGCMIDGSKQHWTPPNASRFGKVSYYTDETPKHYRNTTKALRLPTHPSHGFKRTAVGFMCSEDWFNEYMIGVGGLCSVYDPPVSYWCSEHPSGGAPSPFAHPRASFGSRPMALTPMALMPGSLCGAPRAGRIGC